MIEFSDNPMMAAMQQSLIKEKSGTVEPPKVVEPPKTEPPVQEVKDEKIIDPPKVVDPPKVDPPAEPVKVKTFDEEWGERFGGKSFEEVKAKLEAPVVEFADDNIKHWNDLAKRGIKIDKEFLELQTKDFDKMDDPLLIRKEAMKLKPEYKGLSDSTLDLKLNKEYNLSEWINKDEADLTEEDKANREILMRDAGNDKGWLINYKNERVLEKQPDPAALEAMAKEAQANQQKWEGFVDSDLVNKITKFSSSLNDKGESFEYEISEQDRKDVGALMKDLTKGTDVFFKQFIDKDDKGNLVRNHAALFNMMLKAKNYDKAVALAYADGVSKEALRREREDKNINFKPAEAGTNKETFKNLNEAMVDAVRKQKI